MKTMSKEKTALFVHDKGNDMEPIHLIWRNKPTDYYSQLELAVDGGVIPTRRKKGYSNYDVLDNLVRIGWIEERMTGPRGGRRYHTTKAGRAALAEAKQKLEVSRK